MKLPFLCIFLGVTVAVFAQPAITSFSPLRASAGKNVTIYGTGFSATANNNIIYFGPVRGTVISSSSTQLVVTVPLGAAMGAVSVTVAGLTAYSPQLFIPTFSGTNAKFTDGFLSFETRVYANTTANSLVTADLDNDGLADVICTSNNKLLCLRNGSAPGVTSLFSDTEFSSGGFSFVRAADVNGDGKLDVIACKSLANQIFVFRNTSTSGVISFSAAVVINTSSPAARLFLTDLNADGKPEIIAMLTNSVAVYRNSSSVSLASFSYATEVLKSGGSTAPSCFAAGDVDGDAMPDLVVAYPGTMNVYRNAGSAGSLSFASAVENFLGTTILPRAISLGDLNNDGKIDVVISDSSSAVNLFRNASTTGNVAMVYENALVSGNNPVNLGVADMNGDGKPDIIVQNSRSQSVSMFKNTGTGTSFGFDSRIDYALGYAGSSTDMQICDLDGDGKSDIVFPGVNNSLLFVLRNTASALRFSSIRSSNSAYVNTGTGRRSWAKIGDTITVEFTMREAILAPAVTIAGHAIVPTQKSDSTWNAVYNGLKATDTTVVKASRGRVPFLISYSTVSGITGNEDMVTKDGSEVAFDWRSPVVTIRRDLPLDSITNAESVFFRISADESGLYPEYQAFSLSTTGTVTASLGKFLYQSDGTYVEVRSIKGDGLLYLNCDRSKITDSAGNAAMAGLRDEYYTVDHSKTKPEISSFSPGSATSGESVIILGRDFNGITSVTFGGTAAGSFTVVSPTAIQAVVGSGASGNVAVHFGADSTATTGFTYVSSSTPVALPSMLSFAPLAASAGDTIVITGVNFSTLSSVTLGGTAVASYTLVSPSLITAVVGNGASGNVKVTTAKGTTQLSGFTFLPPRVPPVIAAFEPMSAAQGGVLTVTGTGFVNVLSATLGGTPVASFNVLSSTLVLIKVGNGATGSLSINTAVGSGALSGFTYIPQSSLPVISSFAPTAAAKGTTITITGTNLDKTSSIKLGGTAVASFTVLSSTTLTAVVGSGTSGSLSISTPVGTDSKDGFIYLAPPVITADSALCRNRNVVLRSSASTNVQWYKDNVPISGATAVSYTATTTGVYKIVMTINNVNYTSNAIDIALSPQPIASFTLDGDSVRCFNGNLFGFTNTSTISGANAGTMSSEWYFGDNTYSYFSNPTHTYKNAGTYQVRLIVDSKDKCRDTITQWIKVLAHPTLVITPPLPVCDLSQSVDITLPTVTGGNSLLSYSYWKDSLAVNPLYNANALTAGGTYYIKGTGNNGCAAVKPVTVKINPLPVVAPITGDSSVCLGTTVDFRNATSGGVWSSGNSAVVRMDSTGKATGLQTGIVAVAYAYTSSATGCSDTVTRLITVKPLPIAGKPLLLNYDRDTTLCFDKSITLISKNVYDRYLWSNGDSTSSTQVSFNGNISLKVGSNVTHCYSEPSVVITTRKNNTPQPVIARTADDLYTNNTSLGYRWYLNNRVTGDTLPVKSITSKGIYKVSASIDRVCWSTSADYVVTLDPVIVKKPFEVIIFPNPTNGNFNLQVDFESRTTAIVEMQIYDQNGVSKWRANTIALNSGGVKIPFSVNLAKGVYSMMVRVNGNTVTKQLIIM